METDSAMVKQKRGRFDGQPVRELCCNSSSAARSAPWPSGSTPDSCPSEFRRARCWLTRTGRVVALVRASLRHSGQPVIPKWRCDDRGWLPSAALDEPIGTIGAAALRETAAIVTALIS